VFGLGLKIGLGLGEF